MECWIAARRKLPAYVGEGEQAHRPVMLLWMDPELGVLGFELAQGDGERELLDLFHRVTEQPMVGPPRRPGRIRVEDAALAAVLRSGLRGGIPVEVGPTPMVDEMLGSLFEHLGKVAAELPEPARGYLEGAGLDRGVVRELFECAEVLHRAAPWEGLSDSDVLAVDIPELGVEDGCLSIVGALGESLGFLLFESLAAYDAFAASAETGIEDIDSADFGTDFLALTFDPLDELAPEVQSEREREGWPLASKAAYPVVQRRDRNGFPMPLVERDVRIATACAAALGKFFVTQGRALEAGEPASMTMETQVGGLVRLTSPYEAKDDARALEPHTQAARRAQSADPENGRGGVPRDHGVPHPVHALDERVAGLLVGYAARRFGKRMQRVGQLFGAHEQIAQLAIPWSVYGHEIDGQRVAEWFASELPGHLSREESAWLDAQRGTWLSVWKVEAVESERGVWVRDALSEMRCFVQEVSGSRSLSPSLCVLARVVEHAGLHVFCGIHPRILDAVSALEVLERAQRYLRCRAPVPAERLREFKTGRALIRYWEEAISARDAARSQPPTLLNTHGDALLWTIDHYAVASAERPAIEQALSCLDPSAERRGKEARFRVLSSASDDAVLTGTVTLTDSKLRLESNSKRRADELRERVEGLCEGKLRHVGRTHADPLSSSGEGLGSQAGAALPSEMPAEALEAVRAFKARHYATWADQAMPALSGRTPRDTVKTSRGRALVSALLEDMERLELGQPKPVAYDFSALRRELGL